MGCILILMLIITKITNILNPIGMIIALLLFGAGDLDFVIPLVCGIIGCVYGFLTWGYTVPPRVLFWTESPLGLTNMRLGSTITSGITFFNSAVAIMALLEMFV